MLNLPLKKSVLIVEDEPDVGGLIQYTLEKTGEFQARLVVRGDAALQAFAAQPPDLVLLDLNLAGLDGLEVLRALRHQSIGADVPVIVVTARATDNERIAGLEIGADDYISKPFNLRELVARARAVCRRARPSDNTHLVGVDIYRGTHLFADFDTVSISVDGQLIRLTRREFELLRYLVANRNRVISRDRLLERIWGSERRIDTRSVDVHVGRLRAKLGGAGTQIETVVGLGYRFVEPATG